MNSVLNLYYSDAELEKVFNCNPASVIIYHQRFRTIESLVSAFLPSKTVHDYLDNYVIICEVISNSKYAELTKRNYFDAIIRLISYNQDREFGIKAIEPLATYSGWRYSYDNNYQQADRSGNPTVEEIREAIKVFPSRSFESIIIRLYLEVPVRDDFQLELCNMEDLLTADPTINYLIPCREERALKVLIQRSKNVSWTKSQKPRLYTLSKELTRDFLSYLQSIGNPHKFWKNKMYKKIGQILSQLKLKNGRASINVLRRAVATQAKEMNERAEMAYKSLHTPGTAILYEH